MIFILNLLKKLYINRLSINKINIQFIKTNQNAVQPFKNKYSDVGYNISIIKQHKVINTNIIMYDTGLQLKIPNGYFAEIVPNQSILKFGYKLTNTIIINSNYNDNIYINLTQFEENAMDIEFPFNCCQLIIKKQEFADFIEIKLN